MVIPVKTLRSLLPLVVLIAMPAVATADTPATTEPLPAGKVEIDVRALHCKTCAKKVSRKLFAVSGVTKVTSSVKQNRVYVTTSTKKSVEPVDLLRAVVEANQEPVALRRLDEQLNEQAVTELLEPAEAAPAS